MIWVLVAAVEPQWGLESEQAWLLLLLHLLTVLRSAP